MTMTPKQRVRAILDRQPVDRIPIDIWYTGEVAQMLTGHFGVADGPELWKAMGLDKIAWTGVPYNENKELLAAHGGQPRTLWGTTMKPIQAGAALYHEMDKHGLAEASGPEDVEAFPFWPDPDRFDYEAAEMQARDAAKDFCTIGPWVSLFEIYCGMRGLEQALMDVFMFPDLVQAALDRIESIQAEMMRRYLQRAAPHVDMVFISDDMGSQENLLMPLETWDFFFRDRMARWCELIHSFGVKVFFHTDGAAEALVPRLIDAGIDILNPIQHVCPGMEMPGLKKKYGQKIVFHGGVDNQRALPFGTPDDVRRETVDCLNTLGAGREGFICCSCHNIQAGTPLENILAMIETVKQSG